MGKRQRGPQFSQSKVVYVYGFKPQTSQQEFEAKFFAPLGISFERVNFHGEKLYAFIHCNSVEDAHNAIRYWHEKPMGDHPLGLQCRSKDSDEKPKVSVDKNCVYIFGYTKGTSEVDFKAMLLEPFPNMDIKRIDFNDKFLIAFIHCANENDASTLIAHWNKRPMGQNERPLQARYKEENRNAPGKQSKMDYSQAYAASGIKPQQGSGTYHPRFGHFSDDSHHKQGYASSILSISGLPMELSYDDVFNLFSRYGPVYLLYAEGEGTFKLRYFYDMSCIYACKDHTDLRKSGKDAYHGGKFRNQDRFRTCELEILKPVKEKRTRIFHENDDGTTKTEFKHEKVQQPKEILDLLKTFC